VFKQLFGGSELLHFEVELVGWVTGEKKRFIIMLH